MGGDTFNYPVLWLTLVIIVLGMKKAYSTSKDSLHHYIVIGPLLAYAYVLEPYLLHSNGSLDRLFDSIGGLNTVNWINCLGVLAITVGACASLRKTDLTYEGPPRVEVYDHEKLQKLAMLLAVLASTCFWITINAKGGFVEAYDHAKGGGRASSGYLGESPNLGLVAALFIGLARKGKGMAPGHWILVIFAVSPVLLQGTFGGRRGPLFLSLVAMAFAWIVSRKQRVSHIRIATVFAGILLAVVFVWSQRQHLYLGTDTAKVDMESFSSHLLSAQGSIGSNYVYGSAYIITTRNTGNLTWGRKILVNLAIRPIPRQFWPTKYEDVGAEWASATRSGLGQFKAEDWIRSVGWVPVRGSSAGSLADLYGEFGFGAILVLFLVGRMLATIKFRSQMFGGMWTLIYFEALALSIYLATQSFSAFYHRFLVMAIPTVLIWRFFVKHPASEDILQSQPEERSGFQR